MNEEFIVQVRELLDLDLYVATLALASWPRQGLIKVRAKSEAR